ncbi:eukaryotic aspartyl protease family protein [Striga asiatica]|uniref:Eukaryotic aspartyl protease family protein n=1 Tax=Striga asiatica TaxID=4170 RepID=A0A5A7R5J3_STRAF|nr:eukaryotic aspartyl protease family protein [Striga asiatica]
MDTASSLLWINCEPCGVRVQWPIYDPKDSSSYRVEDCRNTHVCDASGAIKIDCQARNYNVKGCSYSVVYGSGYSQGNLGRETFRLGKDRREVVENVVFGCAHRTNLYMNGILGLGHVRISLVSQYGASKFSYCIGDLADRSYAYNMLAIGSNVQLWGAWTPLSAEDKYYVNLVRIAIGSTWLKTNRWLFWRNPKEYTGGVVVDSGSTLSFIPMKALAEFEMTTKKVIEDELRLPLAPVHSIIYERYTRLCYRGVVARDLKRFPKVTFHFQNRAYMELTPDNVFQQVEIEIFCLAILPSEILKTTVSILGNLMQQNFNIAYDLLEKKLAFKRIKCKRVEDYYGHDEL